MGLILAGLSFTPSLLPRDWQTQSFLCILFLLVGYGLGFLVGLLPVFKARRPDARFVGIPFAFFLLAAHFGGRWNQESRALIDLPPSTEWWSVQSALLSLFAGGLLVGALHALGKLGQAVLDGLEQRVPNPRVALAILVLVLCAGLGLFRRTLFDTLARSINSSHAGKNTQTEEGIVQPTLPNFSGGPGSLISWQSLGRKGRTFVATAPSQDLIEQFNEGPCETPIRIYAGVQSASDLDERVKMAVADLVRAGGFQRKVVVVVTTTGTGWVDELGVLPLEFMYGGDTAAVTVQYSYLPSVFSFLADKTTARKAGKALFEEVHKEWLSLPEEQRPTLLSFGESLGSYGTEAAFPTVDLFLEKSQGVLLVGPPNTNPIWQEALSQREPGSPAVLPLVGNGEVVRFARRAQDLEKPESVWRHPRAVYLQNPSDPIVWWSPELLWRKPEWLAEPAGADVNPAMTWMPILTFWQVSADYLEARAPDGHGHRYGTLPVYAWSKIAPTSGWGQDKADALAELIQQKYR
jgi:uncharacterized membrane protein